MMTRAKETYIERALEELMGAAPPVDVSWFVAEASDEARQAAAARVAHAHARTPRWRALAFAAAIVLGASILWLVWSQTRPDVEAPAQDPAWSDPVKDRHRVVPESAQHLFELLSDVRAVRLRPCRYTLTHAGSTVVVDLDDGMGTGLPWVTDPADQQQFADAVRIASKRPVQAQDRFRPDYRLVFVLEGFKGVHCLIRDPSLTQPGRVRVLDGIDFELEGDPFGEIMQRSAQEFVHGALAGRAMVAGDINRMIPDGEGGTVYAVPSDASKLHGIGLRSLSPALGRFTGLFQLLISDSALTLSADAFQVEQWTEEARAALGSIHGLDASGIRFTDESAAAFIGAMKNLSSVNLDGCTGIGPKTLEALANLEHINGIGLFGSAGWQPEDLRVLRQLRTRRTPGFMVSIKRDDWGYFERRKINDALGNAAVWN